MEYWIAILFIIGLAALTCLIGAAIVDVTERRMIRKENKARRDREVAESMRKIALMTLIDIEEYDKHGKKIGGDHYTINKGA